VLDGVEKVSKSERPGMLMGEDIAGVRRIAIYGLEGHPTMPMTRWLSAEADGSTFQMTVLDDEC
jgi:hypothetical protein